jgi:ATP-dependent DNA ligase
MGANAGGPMLARAVPTLPATDGWSFEPKLDGFRCCVQVTDGHVVLASRRHRPLGRYFPEILAAASKLPSGVILDGELVIARASGVDFAALQQRLHPSESRAARLARLSPAAFVAFDLLAVGGRDVRHKPYKRRRKMLVKLLAPHRAGIGLMPATTDPQAARVWLTGQPPGVEGVVAKRRDQPYRSGARGWQKVRARSSSEAVIGGVLGTMERPDALVLGRFDDKGRLRVAGRTRPLAPDVRTQLAAHLAPPSCSHPWPTRIPASRFGQLPGAYIDYVQVEPSIVVEVETDTAFEHGRWRHPATCLRLRLDLIPTDTV